MPEDIRWIRSYVLAEYRRDTIGTVCIYEATSPDAIRCATPSSPSLPADEIIPVARPVLVRPDPEPATA